jgi:DNA polymerase
METSTKQLAALRRCYVTNAVKHFKWEPRGKRRMHKTPAQREVDACRQWLVAETELLQPQLIVCLGATAARAVLGPQFRLMRDRGVVRASMLGPEAVATVHPSAILRITHPGQRETAYAAMVNDLRFARTVCADMH